MQKLPNLKNTKQKPQSKKVQMSAATENKLQEISHKCSKEKHQRHRYKDSSSDKTEQNRHRRRITNFLTKGAITTSSPFTTPSQEITNKKTFIYKQTSTNKDKEIESLRPQIELLKQNERQHNTREEHK